MQGERGRGAEDGRGGKGTLLKPGKPRELPCARACTWKAGHGLQKLDKCLSSCLLRTGHRISAEVSEDFVSGVMLGGNTQRRTLKIHPSLHFP